MGIGRTHRIPNPQSRFTIVALILFAATAPLHGGLTNPEPFSKAYELILDARSDEAEHQLRAACGPSPSVGPGDATPCLVLQAVSAYWQLLSDPDNTSRDAAVLAKPDAAIASAAP